jgi:hypothetical protein
MDRARCIQSLQYAGDASKSWFPTTPYCIRQPMAWSAQKKSPIRLCRQGVIAIFVRLRACDGVKMEADEDWMATATRRPRPAAERKFNQGVGSWLGDEVGRKTLGCNQWRDHCQLMSPAPEVTVSRLRNAGHHLRAGAAQERQTSKLVVQCFQAALDDWSATHRIAFGRIHQADTIRTRPPFCLLLTVCFTVACFLCWARQGQILQNTSPAAFVLGSATCAHLPSTERGRTSGPQIRKAEPTTHRATNKSTIVSLVIPT